MLNIKNLENSWFFKKISLNSGEVLFNEWDVDHNIYIIISWEIIIEKKLQINNNLTKTLAILKKESVFWEWSLNNSNPKEVNVRSLTKSTLLSINAKEQMEDFLTKNPEEWLNLLKYIIYLWNNRLHKSNSRITSTYEMNSVISNLDIIDNKSIFKLIDTFKSIINASYIIFLEKNPILDQFFRLKYDTRNKWGVFDEILEINKGEDVGDVLKSRGVVLAENNIIRMSSIWNIQIWYFVIWRGGNDFEENEKKIIISIISSLSGVIRQKKLLDEERDKKFMSR